MENNFNEDNFEFFLQQQLQNTRMYPKDAVWREINNKLHGEKRWPALTFASFLIISITTFICLHFSSKQNIFTTTPVLLPLNYQQQVANMEKDPNNKIGTFHFKKSTPVTNDFSNNNQTNNIDDQSITVNNVRKSFIQQNNELSYLENKRVQNINLSYNSIDEVDLVENNLTKSISSNKELAPIENNILNTDSKNSNVELQLQSLDNSTIQNSDINVANDKIAVIKPMSLIQDYKASRKPGKFNLLVYFAPSISYRKLEEDQSVIKGSNNGPVGVNQVADVNDVVRHKPSKGLEGGISMLYDLNKKIKVKSGFQFNVRQYTIDAFRSNTEISSIALVENNEINTVNTLVYYRNFNGNSSTELINRYYQISLPVGLDWEIAGNKKFQINIAGSIQPTYILNKSAYLLTTNFKNYSENNNLVRQWNINTNFEAYISIIVGDVKWQLGPQVRYQPNSTFISQYPIHEYLIDYGIKLGISTNLK